MAKCVFHKQPPRAVLRKRCSENMQQIYRRAPKSKRDFNKVAKQVIVSVHATIELGLYSFRSRSLFWGFEWNERSNNPEKNSNASYISEPQYIL